MRHNVRRSRLELSRKTDGSRIGDRDDEDRASPGVRRSDERAPNVGPARSRPRRAQHGLDRARDAVLSADAGAHVLGAAAHVRIAQRGADRPGERVRGQRAMGSGAGARPRA